MRMADRIRARLETALDGAVVTVVDDSARHAGHAGAGEGGESHFNVRVVAPAFAGQGRVARHRLVNGLLAEEFGKGLHALQLTLLAPGE
ncbi:MAG: BolA family transcriptional regulator [Zavarzinia sp.]|nr:BolA family transcriptional regulator [Zavarzinia sp.]